MLSASSTDPTDHKEESTLQTLTVFMPYCVFSPHTSRFTDAITVYSFAVARRVRGRPTFTSTVNVTIPVSQRRRNVRYE